MKNWKTTLMGVAFGLITLFGPRLNVGSPGAAAAPPITWVNIAQAAAVIALGAVAKDSNVTGGTKAQTTEAQSRVVNSFTL